jgi:CBS-domain-containing membrane protein
MKLFKLDHKAQKNITPYIWQSFLGFFSLFIILFFLDTISEAAIVAALGSSVFVVFAAPHSYPARPQSVIGGHIIGLVCGIICAGLIEPVFSKVMTPEISLYLAASLAVGSAMLLMCLSNTEHAPAAGTALGMVVNEWSLNTIIFIVASVIILSLIKKLMGYHLKTLI